MNYFDEVADMMAQSRAVGPYVTRDQIMAALRKNFPTEAALREHMAQQMAEVRKALAHPDAALLVPPLPGATEWELITRDEDPSSQ
jgi:hypothetical protein